MASDEIKVFDTGGVYSAAAAAAAVFLGDGYECVSLCAVYDLRLLWNYYISTAVQSKIY